MNANHLVDRIVEKAVKAGAASAAASQQRSHALTVSFENDNLKATQSEQRTEIKLKIIQDGKIGSSGTTDPADLDGLVTRALEAVQFGSPANYAFPNAQPAREVKTYAESVLAISRAAMIDMGRGMIQAIKDYNPEIKGNADITRRLVQADYANSNGASYMQESTSFNLGLLGVWLRGTDVFFTGDSAGSKKDDLDPMALARQVVACCRMAEHSATIRSGKFPVIFTPQAVIVPLLSLLLGLNGKNVVTGESPLKDKVGLPILDARINLVDNALLDYAFASSAYDGEGVTCQATPLIQQGMLSGFLHDLDSAGRAGVASTGNGPGPRPSNCILAPGSTPLESMLRNTREGLLINSVLGLGQGNPISGEFSLNVFEGYKIEHGEVVGRVKDVMFAGNVYDLLKRVIALSDQSAWVASFYTYKAPYLAVDGVDITAKA